AKDVSFILAAATCICCPAGARLPMAMLWLHVRASNKEKTLCHSFGTISPSSEPLNSGDDVSDEDPSDLFDTDNVVVCQYDKITRSRNKWKFYLKDGIMNLSGKDYVFQKANGDAEW
ncbi:hypothetical protein L9F63_027225, partial [Diploptera punctata]